MTDLPLPRHILLRDAVVPPPEGHLHRNNAAPKTHPAPLNQSSLIHPPALSPGSLAPGLGYDAHTSAPTLTRSSQRVQAPVFPVSTVSMVGKCGGISLLLGSQHVKGHLAPLQADCPTHHLPQFCLPKSVSWRSRSQLRNEIPVTSLCAKTTSFSDSWTLFFICLGCRGPAPLPAGRTELVPKHRAPQGDPSLLPVVWLTYC